MHTLKDIIVFLTLNSSCATLIHHPHFDHSVGDCISQVLIQLLTDPLNRSPVYPVHFSSFSLTIQQSQFTEFITTFFASKHRFLHLPILLSSSPTSFFLPFAVFHSSFLFLSYIVSYTPLLTQALKLNLLPELLLFIERCKDEATQVRSFNSLFPSAYHSYSLFPSFSLACCFPCNHPVHW